MALSSFAGEPSIVIDPRVETLSIVHSLAGLEKPIKGFAFNKTAYGEAAKARFSKFQGHEAVTLYKEGAKGGMDFVTAFRTAVSDLSPTPAAVPAATPPKGRGTGKGGPGKGSVMNPGGPGPGSVMGGKDGGKLAAALKAFEKDADVAGFLAEQKQRLDGYAESVRAQQAKRPYVKMLEEYTGESVATHYIFIVCALCDQPEGANVVQELRVVSTLGPSKIAKGEPVFDYPEARLGLWHELGHTLLDPLLAVNGKAVQETSPLFETVADCCRGSWESCVREHAAQGLAYAVWEWSRRTGRVDEGPKTLKQDKEPPFIHQVAARYKEFEQDHAAGTQLRAFYPRILDVFGGLLASGAGKKGRSGACIDRSRGPW